MSATVLHVAWHAGDVSVVDVVFEAVDNFDGELVTRVYTVTWVLTREDGAWRLHDGAVVDIS